MNLSERLRAIRGQMGQIEFAKKIGSSQTSVSAFEKGYREPTYDVLFRISQEFGVNIDWLLSGEGSVRPLEANNNSQNAILVPNNQTTNSSVGERIRAIRGKRSREDFSRKYSIHPNTLARWEKGSREASESFLKALAKDEGIAYSWIKTGSTSVKNIQHPQQSSLEVNNLEQSPTVGGKNEGVLLQPTVNTDNNKNNTSDMSEVLELQRELLKSSKEYAMVLSQLGDLRVEVERLRMELERRDRRIEELKKAYNEEHEELMLLKKTLSPTPPQPVQSVTEKELQH